MGHSVYRRCVPLQVVVTRLIGGLGNQLFQYAAGRALAVRHNVPLRLDTQSFEGYRPRFYALDHFKIEASVLSAEERSELRLNRKSWGHLDRFINWVLHLPSLPVVLEKGFEFDSAIFDAPTSCVLAGYWQSPKYFAAIEPQIRSEFTIKDKLDGRNQELARQISESMAVSLHVRRGDYVENALTNRYHGTCSPEYYRSAEQLLRDRIGNIRLFVFSDDPDWAEAKLRFVSPVTIVRHNGPDRDYEDLRLMTLCSHHIIANSTFSWWGAWLCPNQDKVTIAPSDWFKEAKHGADDLIPEDWIRI